MITLTVALTFAALIAALLCRRAYQVGHADGYRLAVSELSGVLKRELRATGKRKRVASPVEKDDEVLSAEIVSF